MKSVVALVFILIFGAIALANTQNDVEISPIEMGVFLVDRIDHVSTPSQIEIGTENGIARLHKFKNWRIKKALAFTTKRNQPKTA